MELAKRGGLSTVKWALYAVAALLLVVSTAAPAYAATGSDQQCSPVAPAPTGISKPTGSSAGTYHYNSCTGLWANDYYTWSPATKQYSPVKPLVYTCDTTSGQWHTSEWVYVASQGKYIQSDRVVANPPAGSVSGTCQKPALLASDLTPAAQPASLQAVSPGGSSDSTVDNNSSTDQNDTNNVTLNNQIGSNATSGDVTMDGNTLAGNATSGDASASASIINSVNTTSGLTAGQVATFTKTINGDVHGNIIIDPNQLQPANVSLNNTSNITLNTQTSGQINNEVNLTAKSGDVNVGRNTKAGDAMSGSASAMASVVNMLNSYVSAGQSFIGTININGNLHGDILMPPKFIDNLIATGAPSTTVTIHNNDDKTVNNQTITNIKNQINSSATSGQVNSAENTESGNAASGNATTKVDVYNLTGHKIVGANSLLVFVNVMGKWVGVIMNAPVGATSAMYGGNVKVTNDNSLNIDTSTNNSITNNIDVAATSGDVNATRNTKVGDASSGDAKTAVSVANLSNDELNLSGWFGVLFINVFGNWYGNFGVVPQAPLSSHQPNSKSKTPNQQTIFKFVPGGSANSSDADSTNSPDLQLVAYSQKTGSNSSAGVLAASIKTPASTIKPAASANRNGSSAIGYYVLCAVLVVIGLSLFCFERVRIRQQAR